MSSPDSSRPDEGQPGSVKRDLPATPLERTVVFAADSGELDAAMQAAFGDSGPPLAAGGSVLRALAAQTPGAVPGVHLRAPDEEPVTPINQPSSEQLPAPQQFPERYQLVGEIARGGMGAILKGRDVDLGRDIAIKVMLETHKGRTELLQRFVEELQIAGQLQHPGIVPVYELGQFGDKRPYFTMKLVKGWTLAALLKERESLGVNRESLVVGREPLVVNREPLVVNRESKADRPDHDARSTTNDPRFTIHNPRLLSIFEQVCQTMAYAHARGVIHRDLKPANIMVGNFGEVQVMDWGLAKVLPTVSAADELSRERDRPEEVSAIRTARSTGSGTPTSRPEETAGSHTAAGSVLGTPAYMAPEQAKGEVDHLDERCDVFGLGAILCAILTGAPPYEGKNSSAVHQKAMRADLEDAWQRLRTCKAERELMALATRCLQPRKEDRPRDAGEVARAVTVYLEGVQLRLKQAEVERAAAEAKAEEESKRRQAEQARAREERRRRQVSVALAAMVVVFVLAASGTGIWYYHDQAAQAEIEARLQSQLAEEQAGKARLEAERETEKAVQAATLAERKKHLTAAVTKEFATIAQQRADLHKRLGDALTAAGLLSDIDQWGTLVGQMRDTWKRANFQVQDSQGLESAAQAAQLTKLDEQIKADERDWSLASKLDKFRVDASNLVAGEFEPDKVRQDFAAVFTEMKLDLIMGEPVQLSAQVKSSPLRYALVAALDHWASVAEANEGELMNRFMKVARLADPDDWRDQVRDPSNWKKLDRLQELAAKVQVEKQTPQILDLLATILAGQGDRPGAAKLLRQALLAHPDDFWLHFYLGNGATDPAERAGCYRSALAIRPKSSLVHYNLALVLQQDMNDLDGARGHYQKAIELHPQDALSHNNLGNVLIDMNDPVGAIKHYHKAIELEPGFALAHHNLGHALHNKNDLDGAIQQYQKAIELAQKGIPVFRNYPVAKSHYYLGLALHAKKDLDGAIKHFQKAIELDPGHALAHNKLGDELIARNDLNGAVRHLQKAIEIFPGFALAHNNLGSALMAKKDLNGAIKHYRKAIELDAKLALAQCNLGTALAMLNDVDGAIPLFRKALELDPKFAKAHYNLGNALVHKQDLAGAIDSFKKAVKFDPTLTEGHFNLGTVLQKKEDLDGAVEHFQKAVALKPNYAKAHYNLGMVLHDKKDLDGAIAHFQKAIAVDPNFVPAHGFLGQVLEKSGKFAEAKKATLQALQRCPPQSPLKALSEAQLARCEKMLALEQKLPAILKGEFQPRSPLEQVELAEMCYYTGHHVSAARHIAAALAKQPQLGNKLRYLAVCTAVLAATGKSKDADQLAKDEPAKLRQQALTWLKAEVTNFKQLLAANPRQSSHQLKLWQSNPDLASVREEKELAKLPEEERQQWQVLWADVAKVLATEKK